MPLFGILAGVAMTAASALYAYTRFLEVQVEDEKSKLAKRMFEENKKAKKLLAERDIRAEREDQAYESGVQILRMSSMVNQPRQVERVTADMLASPMPPFGLLPGIETSPPAAGPQAQPQMDVMPEAPAAPSMSPRGLLDQMDGAIDEMSFTPQYARRMWNTNIKNGRPDLNDSLTLIGVPT